MSQICIICRNEKENFNDEHVIPDSIKGYYHIRKVCIECNSKLGSNIDNTLTNHKFIEFQRHLLDIKGKSGTVPNPFSGTHTIKGDPNQKVIVEVDSEGKFIPRLLPNIPDFNNDPLTDTFTIKLDKRDEKQLDKIVDKILLRNGIDKSRVISSITTVETLPVIHTTLKVDIHNFRAGILKIAYEFTVDTLPDYFHDEQAKVISKLLHDADFDNLDKKVKFIGSGFDKVILQPFQHLIDFDNNNHYLILFSSQYGLLCFVNLFNTFSIGILMSKKINYMADNLYVGKNDIVNREYKLYNINELIKSTYTPTQYRFQHWFSNNSELAEFIKMSNKPDFAYYEENGVVPFFDSNGDIAYKNIEDKLLTMERISKGDTINSMVTEFILDEDLYIKLLPSNNIYKVLSVQMEQHRHTKI